MNQGALLDRLADQFTVGDQCWQWTGKTTQNGYATVSIDGHSRYGHRLLYKIMVGEIPEGLELDHMCHTNDPTCAGGPTCMHRRCVNPGHVEPVTHQENVARGQLGQMRRDKTHCPAGHPYDEANTYVSRAGKRQCRSCKRERERERYYQNEHLRRRPR